MPIKEVSAPSDLLQAPVVWPPIEGHTFETCARTHTIRIDGILFKFSPTQCRLIECILRSAVNKELLAPFEELMQCFEHPEDDLRRSIYRHINTIRKTFLLFELDIPNIREQGYKLVSLACHRPKRRA